MYEAITVEPGHVSFFPASYGDQEATSSVTMSLL
jgi:hypothetical protein